MNMKENKRNRREFIKNGVLGAAGTGLAMNVSAKSYAAIIGANERIQVAVIGLRNQGTVHLSTSLCHLANISYRLSRSLKFNGTEEKFANDREADAMLTREYRKPYAVPDKV